VADSVATAAVRLPVDAAARPGSVASAHPAAELFRAWGQRAVRQADAALAGAELVFQKVRRVLSATPGSPAAYLPRACLSFRNGRDRKAGHKLLRSSQS
jgi:hypothetical protein